MHRFDRIAAGTGVGRDILASRLMRTRRVRRPGQRAVQAHPPHYEYVPTEAGRAPQPVLRGLMDWAAAMRPTESPRRRGSTTAAPCSGHARSATAAAKPSRPGSTRVPSASAGRHSRRTTDRTTAQAATPGRPPAPPGLPCRIQ
ncbi:winged helix-turn-helix transcriptional regulator [Streptomyces celluloflavus]|uniref:winged helix-turn-helix transcriptional regulator n=1 Tax=Streptomyces celluloflavus TaxID=58344 RepID=UPI0036CEF961